MKTDEIKIRKYTVLLYQTSTNNPQLTPLQNTTGYNWTCTRESAGRYILEATENGEPVNFDTIRTTAQLGNNVVEEEMSLASVASNGIYIITAKWNYPDPGFSSQDGLLIFTRLDVDIYITAPLTII